MPFNSQISRSDAGALMPEDAAKEILQNVPQASSVMRLAKRLPNMSKAQRRLPVVSVLPVAYFVSPGASDDTGRKQTTEVNWDNVYVNAEELAVIVPIPESVLDDADYDIWAEIQPSLVEAFGKAFDEAVFYGTNKPSTWPTALITSVADAGNSVSLAAFIDLYDAVLGVNGSLSKMEADGYFPTGHIATMSMRAKLRGTRDADGQPIFRSTPTGPFGYELDGLPVQFPRNGAMDATQALLISGDWDQLVYAIRKDISYKVLDQAVIQDAAGNIVYNLAQQDMVALRAVMRLGWQLPNPPNRIQPTAASRSQFSVLTA